MASGFSMQIQGLDELLTSAKEAGSELPGLLQQAMVVSTEKIKSDIQGMITQEGITNTGALVGSVTIIEASSQQGIVGVGEAYGQYVEEGTQPHWPPIDAIERWAETKLGTPGLGFVIARKISKVGTKAHPFVEPVFLADQEFVQQQFDWVSQQIVQKMGD